MQVVRAKKEQFLSLPMGVVHWLLPLLRVVELQVFLACWQIGQGRWARTQIVLSALASRVGKDRAQVRRSLRSLAAAGVLQVEAGDRPGSYRMAPPAPDALELIREELRRRKRPRAGVRASEGGAELRLVPPPLPQPPKKSRASRKGRRGGDGGDRSDPPGGSPSVALPPPIVPPVSPPPTPPLAPPPAAPAEIPEPFRALGVIDWTELAAEPETSAISPASGGTISHVGGGLPEHPISRSGEISKEIASSSLLPASPPCARASEESDETSDEFSRIFEESEESEENWTPGKVLSPEEICSVDPEDPRWDDAAEEAGTRATTQQVEFLWMWVEAQGLPGLSRRLASPLLYRLLTWSDRYETARDYLVEELPKARRDRNVRSPLAYVCHEPRFVAWRAEKGARSARRGPGGTGSAPPSPRGQDGPVTPNHGPPPLSREEWAPIQAELQRRIAAGPPPPTVPGQVRPLANAWSPEQKATNASGARAALAALQGPPAEATLAADFSPGAVGVITHRGYRYTRTEATAVWRRVGRA